MVIAQFMKVLGPCQTRVSDPWVSHPRKFTLVCLVIFIREVYPRVSFPGLFSARGNSREGNFTLRSRSRDIGNLRGKLLAGNLPTVYLVSFTGKLTLPSRESTAF